MIVAITGCIGSGKSYILKQINLLHNIDVFSADEFTLQAYENEIIKQKLDKVFNCIKDGKVDKSIIKIKLNSNNINKLNAIIHPFVKDCILDIKNKYINDIAFIEVPLLFETNMETLFDATISIDIDDELRHKRLKKRNEKAYKDMLKLEKQQFSNEEKAKRATYVLKSSENEDLNLKQLNDIIYVIRQK